MGFLAPADPLELNKTEKFDFIAVSSLFTHLNRNLFEKWVKALGDLLNLKGILSISLHILEFEKNVFKYTETSEDDLFPETSESLGGKNIYGLTYMSLDVFYTILEQNLDFKYTIVANQDWAGSQSLVSIQRTSI